MWRFVIITAVLQTMGGASSRIIPAPEAAFLPSQDTVVRELVRHLRSSNSDNGAKERYSPYRLLYSEGKLNYYLQKERCSSQKMLY